MKKKLQLNLRVVAGTLLIVLTTAAIGMPQGLMNMLPFRAADDTSALFPIAGVQENQLWLDGFDSAPQPVTGETEQPLSITSLIWSPDGEHLAFVITDAEEGASLMVSDRLGTPPVRLASGLEDGLPVSFAADGDTIVYAAHNPESMEDQAYAVDTYRIAPSSEAMPELLGSFQYGVGCGGGTAFPQIQLYYLEAGYMGNGLTLVQTPFGLVHSVNCGGIGIGLLDLETGEDIILDIHLSRAAISPNRAALAGIRQNTLVLVDLATGDLVEVETAGVPDQVTWGVLNSDELFYSVREETGRSIELTDAQQQQLAELGIDAAEIPVMTVAIHRLNLETGEDQTLYTEEAYAISRMTVAPDNQILLFSQIPDMQEWLEGVINGTIDPLDQAAVQTRLYALQLKDGMVEIAGTGYRQATLNGPAYLELRAPQPVITLSPTSGAVQTLVTVNGRGFAANSRVSVFLGSGEDRLDETPYAAGFTNREGVFRVSFNIPGTLEDGRPLSAGALYVLAATGDTAFRAGARFDIRSVAETTPRTSASAPQAVMSISPVSGTANTPVLINVRGFPANTRVNIHLGAAHTGPGLETYASAYTDRFGQTNLSLSMPAVYANGTSIQDNRLVIQAATDDYRTQVSLFFDYTPLPAQPVPLPAISISPTSGTSNTEVSVSGRNYPAFTGINILVGPSAGNLKGVYRTVNSDHLGNFQGRFTMPSQWPDGTAIPTGQLVILAATVDGLHSALAQLAYTAPRPQLTATASPTATDTPVIPTEEPTVVDPTETPAVPTEAPTDTPVPGEETPVVEPTDEPSTPVPQPLIGITPSTGSSGTMVTVTGSGFPVNIAVYITLTDGILTSQIVTSATNDDGDFVASFLVPDVWLDGAQIVDGELAILAYVVDYSVAVTAPFTLIVTE